ncbi:MAG: KamA family radical SAM protein [Desulfobacteraceae bacterium]|nr:KamA family radical SAM protein [Desulfobacteraceae bacterium]
MPTFDQFARKWHLDAAPLEEVVGSYPFRLNTHFEGLIGEPGDPVWRQVVPSRLELSDESGLEDPLSEEALSPAPNLVHRYPNRVLWLVNDRCAVHCRFCTRKRKWREGPSAALAQDLSPALAYIRQNEQIRDVLLSGGDPLLLPLERLEEILRKLREIPHVQIIRIGSRVPGAQPSLVTPEAARLLAGFHPLYVNIHFNHPAELTPEAKRACSLLADAGIPLGSQTVLLRGVNDSAPVLSELFHRLLAMRVRPYYLMQMDLTKSTAHFRTPVATGLKILRALRNRISGLAMPHFVIDLPGGHGKVALVPEMVREIGGGRMIVENYLGKLCPYPLLAGEEEELGELLTPTVGRNCTKAD